jgi:exosortase/archaeosortase family protein
MIEKGFRNFLIKTGIFLGLFILISFVIGQRIVASSLLYGFKLFIYGGMGRVLLFSIFGFVLFYRDRLLVLKDFKYKKRNALFVILSFVCVVLFYALELNIKSFSPTVFGIIIVHTLFLSIFVFLILGIFGLKFVKYFILKFKKELGYFLIFGVVVYSLMYQVWKLWPILSFVVTKISVFLLGFVGEARLIDQYTISFNGFAAQIGEACSGLYSIFIFSALYVFAVILDWKKLNKWKVVLVFIPAVVGAFFVNVLRVFLLFVIGAEVSRDIAIGLYHSYTGMIFFLVYFALFWVLFYDWMKR